jgi:tetratricopeptide (TPR) repeat protein
MSRIPRSLRILLSLIGILVLAVAVYNIPFVNDRLAWRVDEVRSQIIYFFKPPAEAVFIPEQQSKIDSIVTATLLAMRTPTLTPTLPASSTPVGPTPTPTITPTPLPGSVTLPGVVYVDQMGGYNLCGPSNLTMALKFWKWKGQRDEILRAIKPGINDAKLDFWKRGQTDKNVMPYEMVDYVNDNTDLRALSRYGGSLDLLKSFIAAGYPMLIEKGEYQRDTTGVVSWMGHYQFITGYDDIAKTFLVQDTYLDGPNFKVPYDKLSNEWRAFNYIFMVVYPADKEDQVQALLGSWSDVQWANQHALDIADQETKTLTGLDAYFAWFNKGTSHVQLLQYVDAATAYDQAFQLYAALTIDKAKYPYRMLWYQTGPYKAYYYAARYQDVINLANVTLSTVSSPTLEESLYWRGMAEQASGNLNGAESDYRTANHLNPQMTAIIQALQAVGGVPEAPVH